MFKKEARVTQIENGRVILSFARNTMCGHCSNMFCGARHKSKITLKDTGFLKVNDIVEVGLKTSTAILLSVLIFFVPSLVLIGVIYLSRAWSVGVSFSCALAAVVLYFIVLRVTLIKALGERVCCQILRRIP